MVSKTVKVTNASGFHMRPATTFAGEMGKFKSRVTLEFGGRNADGKSLMNIIAACIKCGSEVNVVCDGVDEDEALARAVAMIEAGFGE